MNLIKQLKQNERPFGLCSKEEQACFVKVGIKNLERYSGSGQKAHWHSHEGWDTLFDDFIYRIKAGYKPEPEIVELCSGMSCKQVQTFIDQRLAGVSSVDHRISLILIANLATSLKEAIAEQ